MTKSGRHKKFRKQEKAKTQLTGVKKLSKAKNVVVPTLRSKKILIREQLKSGSGVGPSSQSSSVNSVVGSVVDDEIESAGTGFSRRKQSIQELLSSANHHNTNCRKEALLGLQEIASSQINTVIRNLDKVLAKIASLTSDPEGIVRKENLKLAEMIISKINDNQLRPFWSLLIAHLKCTMTHLQTSVRISALPFITMLTEHHPMLVSESSSIILPSILGMISTSSNSKEGINPKLGSTQRLKVEITGKQNDLVARLNVLRLLSKCLLISTSNQEKVENLKIASIVDASKSQYLSLKSPFGYNWDQADENEVKQLFLNVEDGNVLKSYTDRFYSVITADIFSSPFTSDPENKNKGNIDSFWSDFTQSCIPVLIETWVECGPLVENSAGYRDKKGTKKSKQSQSTELRSDMESVDSMTSRRNGFHILNDAAVESLLCITTLLADLIQRNKKICSADASSKESIKTLQKLFGQNVTKYFFSLMPYVSLQESRKNDVIAANLNLFRVAGELEIFDKEMKKKLRAFIETMMNASSIEKDHCESFLNIFSYLHCVAPCDYNLSSRFLIHVTQMGYEDAVVRFLSALSCPTRLLQKGKYKEKDGLLLDSLQWDEIIREVLQSWSRRRNDGSGDCGKLMDLLTFVALRRLVDLKGILLDNMTLFEDLLNASKTSGAHVRDAVYRAFFYSNAEDIFYSKLMVV